MISPREPQIAGNLAGGHDPNAFIGQHILVDQEKLSAIAELIPAQTDCVEIGPGFGALTEKLLDNGNSVTAYEIDRRCEVALDSLALSGDLTVNWQNFLDVPNAELDTRDDYTIVGNIPFHISEPLMTKLADLHFEAAVLLVGERLAKAIAAKDPASSGWSRMSMIAQGFFDFGYVMPVPRDSFYPPPRVDGAVIKLTRKEDGQTNWMSDPQVMSYRAIAEANAENSTIAKALKTINVDANGRMQGGGAIDKATSNRRQRRTGKLALKDYANQFNLGGEIEQGQLSSLPIPETMFSIVSKTVGAEVLSKPLSGISNQDLRKVCAAISGAVNRKRKV